MACRPRLSVVTVAAVPALPASRSSHLRQRGEETPSHPGGLSEVARQKLEERRRAREGITAKNQPREDGPRGLGDFQRRLNRDQPDRRRDGDRARRDWDATPRSERGRRAEDAPSVRIPNASWDATPRRGSSPGSSSARNRRWDAPTPRRGGSPGEDGEGALGLDAREWEEEQTRLDRDWYMGAEEGGVMGEEEYNPLSQYDDLAAVKEEQLAKKQVKKISARQAQYVRTPSAMPLTPSFLHFTVECGQRLVGSQSDGHVWGRNAQGDRPRLRGRV